MTDIADIARRFDPEPGLRRVLTLKAEPMASRFWDWCEYPYYHDGDCEMYCSEHAPEGSYQTTDSESDCIAQCSVCYETLFYTLTPDGARDEFWHFVTHGVSLTDPVSCFHFAQAVQALKWSPKGTGDLWELVYEYAKGVGVDVGGGK